MRHLFMLMALGLAGNAPPREERPLQVASLPPQVAYARNLIRAADARLVASGGTSVFEAIPGFNFALEALPDLRLVARLPAPIREVIADALHNAGVPLSEANCRAMSLSKHNRTPPHLGLPDKQRLTVSLRLLDTLAEDGEAAAQLRRAWAGEISLREPFQTMLRQIRADLAARRPLCEGQEALVRWLTGGDLEGWGLLQANCDLGVRFDDAAPLGEE